MSRSQILSVIRGAADLVGDNLQRGRYQDVILPLTVLGPAGRVARVPTPNGLPSARMTCRRCMAAPGQG